MPIKNDDDPHYKKFQKTLDLIIDSLNEQYGNNNKHKEELKSELKTRIEEQPVAKLDDSYFKMLKEKFGSTIATALVGIKKSLDEHPESKQVLERVLNKTLERQKALRGQALPPHG